MIDFSSIARCSEISDEIVARAVTSRDGMRALLARASEIARPMQGAARVLVALSRMATTACDWLDGELVIEIVGDEEVCVVEVMSELGGDLRERIFPTFTLHVPLDEFARAVRLVPRMVAPLAMHEHGARLVFTASAHVRHSTHPPRPADVEQDLLTIELGAPESAPKLRVRPPSPSLAKPPASAPKLPAAPAARPPASAPKLPIAVLDELRESSSRLPVAPMAVVEELRESSSRLPVVEERVDRGSSRRMPIAPVAEERGSAKVPIVPREDDDLSGFLDDLELEAPPASAPKLPAAPAPAPTSAEPPTKSEPRAPPMLMPRMTPKPKPKRERASQKPTIARMSAIRPEELAALKPAKVPDIHYDRGNASADADRTPSVQPDVAEAKIADEAQQRARKLASTKPPPDGARTTARPTSRPAGRASAPPTVRPIGAAVANVRDESVDEGWDE